MAFLKYWREIVIAILLAGAAFAGYEWLQAHDARIVAQTTIAQQAQLITQDKRQADALIAEQKQRDAATAAQIAAMQSQVAQIKTAEQIIKWLPAQVATPQPVKIEIPEATAANPTPAAQATISQADLPALRDYVESCKECDVNLHSAQQAIALRDARLKLAGEQLSAAETQRDAALSALKGGSFWHRLKHDAKTILIGAAAGAIAVCGTGHCK